MAANPKFPDKQLFLVYGNNEAEVSDTRYQIVCHFLTPEERDAGLAEIRGPGNQPLRLDQALNTIVEELGTTSFLDDSRRVVVIHDLQELMESRAKKPAAKGKSAKKAKDGPSRTEALLKWFDDVFLKTKNVAIFVCNENEEKRKSVSEASDIYTYIRRNGHMIERRDKPLQFDFEDQLLSGNAGRAIQILRDWMRRAGSDSGGRLRIYQTISQVVELSLQAQCQEAASAAGIPINQISVGGFPSLDRVPAWKAKKIKTFAQRFPLEKLRVLVGDLNRLQTIMYPSGNEDYVPNWEERLETIVLKLTVTR